MAAEEAEPPSYEVRLSPKAEKYIEGLRKKDAILIVRALQRLETAPREGAEKLEQNPSFWRVRAGNHRIVYAIYDGPKMIIVAKICDRKDAYRDISKLDPAVLVRKLAPTLASIRAR
jgi:mRNA-degrading endonuclease RelE of RelBE toxin-antitoxin system